MNCDGKHFYPEKREQNIYLGSFFILKRQLEFVFPQSVGLRSTPFPQQGRAVLLFVIMYPLH